MRFLIILCVFLFVACQPLEDREDYLAGYDVGHDEGRSEGHDEGYDEGYEEGKEEVCSDIQIRFNYNARIAICGY